MFSSETPANLKVVGTEGHTPETLRTAVDHGAKFVIYSYNFSLVVMSFKRPSNVHFVAPGRSRILVGLPYTLISFVFGWWGIPWGIIYTIQSLAQNLGGGTDVTQEMLAALAPVPAAPGNAASAPPPPLVHTKEPYSFARMARVTGVVAATAAIVYVCVCFFLGQNMDVALVSGLSEGYTVELNGTSHRLSANQPVKLSLAEGEFVLRGAPGAKDEQRFTAQTEFLSRPLDRRVLVINPDRLALVYVERTVYRTTPADPNEQNSFDLHTNRLFHHLPSPDYFFEDFPQTISMSKSSSGITKTRLAAATGVRLEGALSLVSEKQGYDAMRDYLAQFATLHPDDEEAQSHVARDLKPDDARRIFESHLAVRPVQVEWHRAYQYFAETHLPDAKLDERYRAWMEASPDDGALIYLYARLITDPAISRPYYEKALRVSHPSSYAAYALGADAFAEGKFSESLELLQQAEQSGLNMGALRQRKRDCLLALGRTPEALATASKLREQDRTDTALLTDELMLAQSLKPDRAAGEKTIADFVSAMRKRYRGEDFTSLENYLGCCLAYALGEERKSAELSAKLEGPMNQFQSAIGLRDHQAAAKALASAGDVPALCYWMLMLTAQSTGDTQAADKYFAQAVEKESRADRHSRATAVRLASGTPEDHAEILRTPGYSAELRVLFTALGQRYPEHRERYFARARALDREPGFPHLLLTAVRGERAL